MRIQPGDLAISIHTQQPQNNGLIVQVVKLHVNSKTWPMTEKAWWCTCAQPMTWKVRDRFVHANEGPVPEACLFPIRGAGQDSLTETKKPVRKKQGKPAARPLTAVVPASPLPAIETTPETSPMHEVEVADGVHA